MVKLLTRHPKIKVFAITVNKKKVKPHIRQDPNKLYDYMIGLILLDKIKRQPSITFIPDQRSIKVRSGNSLADYLKTELWFKLDSKTVIENSPRESHKELNLQFVDCVSNIIWRKYEDNKARAYNILNRKVKLTHLFFPTS